MKRAIKFSKVFVIIQSESSFFIREFTTVLDINQTESSLDYFGTLNSFDIKQSNPSPTNYGNFIPYKN